MTAGRLTRLALLVLLLTATGWLTIWSSTPVLIQAQPPEGLDDGRAVREDDLLDKVLAAGILVVGTDANYPPFSFFNEEDELVGFDVDVAKEVATRLGVAIDFELPLWGDVVAGGWGALWDVSIGSMTPTDDRAVVLWFTEPYYYYPGIFAIHQDNTTLAVPAQLAGEQVGATAGSPDEAYLNGLLELGAYGGVLSYPPPVGADVIPYANDGLAFADLAAGDGVNLDAVLAHQVSIHWAIEDGAPFKYLGAPVFYEPIVMALDQARGPSDEMISALNTIIGEMRDDGTLAAISIEWLGVDITSAGPAWPQHQVFLPVVLR